MRKYSKFFRSEISDDTDSQCSSPCSPTITPGHGNGHAFERQLSKLSSFNFKPTGLRSGSIPVPPEEFRCPISLQLMYDPVIISSGQTYERTCIEKWFNDGHHTCPKTQQHLLHSCLTPNYCVKALIGSWCQQNKLPLPIAPPSSLDLNYWRLALGSEQEIILLDSKSMDSRVVPIDKKSEEIVVNSEDFEEDDLFVRYEKLLYVLYNGKNGKEQHDAVEQIRLLLKDNDEARAYMGANGFIDGLFLFLRSAIEEGDENSQAVATMALFNLSVNNSRNKRLMLSAGVITLLEEMMLTSTAYEAAVALYLNLSCLDNAKPVIGSSKVVPFLVKLLRLENCKPQCRADSLHTLYNISNYAPNINSLLCAGIVNSLHTLITRSSVSEEKKIGWAEKSIAVLINLASNKLGRRDIISTPGLVSDIAKALDTDDPVQQEQAIYCLLQLCNEDPTCCNMVLQEGVIPALVLVSATGTPRGKEKAQKLLMLFREIRQSESSPEKHRMEINRDNVAATTMEGKYLVKSPQKRTSRSVRRRLTAIWKRKYFSLYQCVGD
ncbi:U-box domain-containing protein [Zostera marina]|uniref:RING-type E3 ubiquitin transferase n=1 Tax=Zostera marina TaxID=29655 RepID=A0A0K9PTS1_ZOSMR|nr:U-box domain-containing protein [Zostera marina]